MNNYQANYRSKLRHDAMQSIARDSKKIQHDLDSATLHNPVLVILLRFIAACSRKLNPFYPIWQYEKKVFQQGTRMRMRGGYRRRFF